MDSNFSKIFNRIPRYNPKPPFSSKSFFFSTNEYYFEDTLASLKTLPKRGNTVIGVSGLFSLDLLSARMSAPRPNKRTIRNFIVVDKSSVVKTFWRSISRIIAGSKKEKAPSREEVIRKIKHLIQSQKNYLFQEPHYTPNEAARSACEKFDKSVAEGTSFASSDKQFQQIQKIFREGHFQFLRMDMSNSKSFETLGNVFKKHQLSIDLIYSSNIEDWLTRSHKADKFSQSLSAIRGENTILVDSIFTRSKAKDSRKEVLVQRIHLPDGSLISSA